VTSLAWRHQGGEGPIVNFGMKTVCVRQCKGRSGTVNDLGSKLDSAKQMMNRRDTAGYFRTRAAVEGPSSSGEGLCHFFLEYGRDC
jgi:hypothetical protein